MKQTRMDRLWIIGGVVGAIAIVAAAWLFVVSPEFDKVSSLNSQTADAQAQNITMQAKVHSLQAEYAKLPDLQASLAKARTALPTASGLADFTREVTVDAAATGVNVTSVSVGNVGLAGSPSKAGNAAGSVFAIPVTVIVKGRGGNAMIFAERLIGPDKRAALVSSTQVSADSTNKDAIQLSIQVSLFAAPQSPAELAQLQKLMATSPN